MNYSTEAISIKEFKIYKKYKKLALNTCYCDVGFV